MSTDLEATRGTVTRLLAEARAGVGDANDRLFAHVQMDLRKLAQSVLNRSRRPPSVLGGTELVGMAVMRLLDRERLGASDRAHFFFLLGRAMQDVLVEECRRERSKKRGGGWRRVSSLEFAVDEERVVVDAEELERALNELERQDAGTVQLIRLRFFSGLTIEETAETTGKAVSKVRRDWDYARAWLVDRLGGSAADGPA